ncbi:MAG TPA: alginate lyase family protein [Candidatus Sulfotelmatobacter sp.]|nr:alginate lyase family protein [Candidatus Sulfotelmatobacter sp.]
MPNRGSSPSRLARALSMPPREVLDRLRQFATARADVFRYRSADNLAQCPQLQDGTVGRFFFATADIPALVSEVKRLFPLQVNDIVARAEKICRHRFDLLGYEDLDFGAEIDWHLDPVHGRRAPRQPWFKVKYLDFEQVGDSKIIWELNRHQHFMTLARAFRISGDERFAREIFSQWTAWHKQNPYPMGINWASSLEVALRSLSWVWTYFLLQGCPLFTPELRRQWLSALSLSERHVEAYLSTYFSPNTHLLGEALALFFVGTLFPGLRPASRWQRRGWEILKSEAAKQVREDGFYFEQSAYYHVYALDMFLHARILASLNSIPIPGEFDQNLERMLDALLLLSRAGTPLSIGDDDGGRLFDPRRNQAQHLLDPLAAGSVLYGRGDFKFLAGGPREESVWLLGLQGLAAFDALPEAEPTGVSSALRDSGIYLLYENSGQQLQIDAGPLGAGSGGHGHADALSVGLVRQGQPLLLDPGTFEYVGDSGERARLRGTGAHNTLLVDGRDQVDSTGPFSWSDFPRVTVDKWITGRHFNLFHACHDGYSRLASPVLHHRWVLHAKDSFWLVRDLAEGDGVHQLDIIWHMGPALRPESSRQHVFSDDRHSLAVLAAEADGWSQSVSREYWSPAYGQKAGASVLTFGARVELPADFATIVKANERAALDVGEFVRINSSKGETASGYRYSNSSQEHAFFFAGRQRSWNVDAWASDAEVLWCSWEREKERYSVVLCNGSYADSSGRRVLTCGKRVSYAEVVSSGGKVEIFSPEAEQVVLEQALDRVWADRDVEVPASNPKRMGV